MHSRKNAFVKYSFFTLLFVNGALMGNAYLKDNIQVKSAENINKQFSKQVKCLAENIYYEAGREPYEGKLAVAQVTMNRVNDERFPESICEVVHQRNIINGVLVCQFTWTCLTVDKNKEKYAWEESVIIARNALTNARMHDTLANRKALFYHADYVQPGWNRPKIIQIGRHIFYS